MTDESLSLDDLHGDEEIIVADPIEGDPVQAGDPVKPADEDPILDPPPAEEPIIPDTDDTPAIDRLLASFNLVDKKIKFDDGTETPYDELTETEKFDVLNHLIQTQKTPLEKQYDLDENEIQAVNMLRQAGKSFEQVVNEMAEVKLKNMQATEQFSIDFKAMDPDQVYMTFLKEKNPGLSDADLAEDLELAKKSKSFDKVVESLRNTFDQDQENKKAQWYNKQKAVEMQAIDEDKYLIVEGVREIEEICGWKIDETQKNEVLADLVDTDENGDSQFIKTVLTDPKEMFRAAWLLKNAESLFNRMDDYYKKKMAEKVAEAVKAVKENREPSTYKANTTNKTKDTPPANEIGDFEPSVLDLEGLHED